MATTTNRYIRSFVWFILTGFCLASFGGASILSPSVLEGTKPLRLNPDASGTLKELHRLGLLTKASQPTVEGLLAYQLETGKSLAEILQESRWLQSLGFAAHQYKATWYAANPF